jgi:asparagine synthase (glutamine-hydrolysing)
MCGIFSILNLCHTNELIGDDFNKGSRRGPEFSSFNCIENANCIMGFHRLAINGLDNLSNQPFNIDNIMCICNGEIYNHTTLYQHMNDVKIETNSDCEVIIHLYKKYGFKQTAQMLDGVFAIVLIDMRNLNKIKAYVTRDPHGVRPLYEMKIENQYWFASEMKMMTTNYNKSNDTKNNLIQFPPGTYSKFNLYNNVCRNWSLL